MAWPSAIRPVGLVLLSLGAVPARVAPLTFVESHANDRDGVAGLKGANAVTVSPDGRNVYVASGADSAVATFEREPESGTLRFLLALIDALTADGIGGASAVVVSPDGRAVYVAGKQDSSLAVFQRDATTGLLSFLEAHFDGLAGVDGLGGATAIAVSPEASSVYVVADTDSSVAAFQRDPRTGSLAFLEAHFDGLDGLDGLASARGVAVSPDGANVYAVGRADNAIVAFARDPATGRLEFVETLVHEVDIAGGLRRPNAVVASDDGRQVYVASFDDDIIVFDRDETTGRLAFVQKLNLAGGPFALALAPGGDRLYAKSFLSSTMIELNVLSRDMGTGRVAFVETQTDGVGGASGSPGTSLAVSGDSRHVYVASDRDSTLSVFTTDTPCPGDCEPTATPESPTATPTMTPTSTTVPSTCAGDCDRDGTVSVGELVTGVNIGLENMPLAACPAFDVDGNSRLTIDELLAAVGSGLAGCAGA